jgi:hypothetical protein
MKCRNISLHHHVHTSSEAHLSLSPMVTGRLVGSFEFLVLHLDAAYRCYQEWGKYYISCSFVVMAYVTSCGL